MSSAPPTLSAKDPSVVEETCIKFDLSTREFHAIQAGAIASKDVAYCPYSKFRVGAAILCADDESCSSGTIDVVTGANVENASYPVGTCAERVAFGKAITEGKRKFKALAVSTDIAPPASPCGMCRQFIREFCLLDMPIFMFDRDDDFIVMTLGQLLPMSFGPDSLPPPGAPGT